MKKPSLHFRFDASEFKSLLHVHMERDNTHLSSAGIPLTKCPSKFPFIHSSKQLCNETVEQNKIRNCLWLVLRLGER